MAIRTKKDAARVLTDVAGDKRFFCQDGCISKNLLELTDCLSRMGEDAFHHHVTSWKNDFSNWVRDVFGDDKLASALTKVTSPIEAAKVVRERIAWLQKKLE